MVEPVPCGPHLWILDLASTVLWRRPVEVIVGGDGRNHNLHLWSDGLVWWEIIVFLQNLGTLVAAHSGLDRWLMLIVLGIQMDVAAWDVDAQLVSLRLLRLYPDPLLIVNAGDCRVFIAARFVGYTVSVSILCDLVHCGSETFLQAKTSKPFSLCSMIVVKN